MRDNLDEVKRNALRFDTDLRARLSGTRRIVRRLRVRTLVFRDYYADEQPMQDSAFLELPQQSDEFHEFVNRIEARGGGQALPTSGLEALAVGLKSARGEATPHHSRVDRLGGAFVGNAVGFSTAGLPTRYSPELR